MIDFVMKFFELSFYEAMAKLNEDFGLCLQLDENDRNPFKELALLRMRIERQKARRQIGLEAHGEPPDNTAFYRECKKRFWSNNAAIRYLGDVRGIRDHKIIDRFWIGADKAGNVVIPVSRSFYVSRSTGKWSRLRYTNPYGVSVDIFNRKALLSDCDNPVFVTEGIFDALSILQAGGDAIALNGTSNAHRLTDGIENGTFKRKHFVLCLDNDEAGQKATNALAERLDRLDVPFTIANICGGCKDPNEADVKDPNTFYYAVQAAIQNAERL